MPRRFSFRLFSLTTPTGDHVPDGELLRRFARDRDSAAFELLVRRHADAVWTACRRVLASETEAEDAFQATFLVLVRKAATVRGANIGGWLFRVAVTSALKLRAKSARMPVATANYFDNLPAPSVEASDLSAVVQEEIACLPERYRLPLVLCELQGHTHTEAAKVLGWPVGSVSGRLSRARVLLRNRLARRGVSAPSSLLPATGLSSAIIRDTTAVAVGAALIPPRVSTVTKEVISTMRAMNLKQITIWVLSIGLVAAAALGSSAALTLRPEVPSTSEESTPPGTANQKEQPIRANPTPSSLKVPKVLLEKRLELARSVFAQNLARVKAALGLPSELAGWSERWLDAELALVDKPDDRVKALRSHLDRTREVERLVMERAKTGQGRKADADAATYYRVEAEIRLLKEGVEPHPEKETSGKPEKK